MNMTKHYIHLTTVVVIGLLIFAWGIAPAFAETEHCPDKDSPNKVEVSEDFGPTVTVPEGNEFCVKAGTQASGVLVSDGEPYTVTWTNNGGQTPGISYYIDYDGPDPEPSPEPSPSITPTPEPTPTDSPSPSVTPEPPCAEEDMSARGYCPGEEGHEEELCSVGIATSKCPDVEEPEPVVDEPEELPNTGLGSTLLLLSLGSSLLGAGTYLLKRN